MIWMHLIFDTDIVPEDENFAFIVAIICASFSFKIYFNELLFQLNTFSLHDD